MENYTFDQLPQVVSKLHDRLDSIEQLLLEGHSHQPGHEEPLTITQAAGFLDLAVPTLYGKVSRKEIPVNKKGKRLYFYKSELMEWIKAGKRTVLDQNEPLISFSRKRRFK